MGNQHKPSWKKRIGLNLARRYIATQSELHDLTYLFWECTLRCNINCLHCGSECRKEVGVKDMPWRDFTDITAQVAQQYDPAKVMVIITGGEPLVRKDLEEAGMELQRQGYAWGMVSNGLALSPKRLERLLKAGLRSATISLDGLEKEHNWLRQHQKSYNNASRAIQMLAAQPEIVMDVVTCVNQRNLGQLPEIRDHLIQLGVKSWRLFIISPIGRAADVPELDLSPVQFEQLMEFIKQCRLEGQIAASFGCEGFLGNYENEVRDGYFFCRAGINISSVLADGAISACPNNCSAVAQGNIYKDDFLDVWNNKYQIMRDRNWTKTGVCTDCEAFKWCLGNATHLREPGKEEVLRCHYRMLLEA